MTPTHEDNAAEVEVVTAAERPELDDEVRAITHQRWPEYIYHDAIGREFGGRIFDYIRQFTIRVLKDGRVIASGWGVPFVWDGVPEDLPEGWRAVLRQSFMELEQGVTQNAFSCMEVAVAPSFDRQGVAGVVLRALVARAEGAGLNRVVAPLRPTLKPKYPLVGMAAYAQWTRDDGLSIDPWIRTHQRLGAKILQVAPDSMVIEGTVAEWEQWAGMAFPASGTYVVPGALNLVEVDREADIAIYREENLWVQHR